MEKEHFHILTINPGSTSTKIGVFEDEVCTLSKTIRHEYADLMAMTAENGSILGQKEMRRELVLETLREEDIALASFDAFVGYASRLPPLLSGTYLVDDALLADVPDPLIHAGLLGALIAKDLSDITGAPAFVVDPATVDELTDKARITGIPGIKRTTICHVLNHHAVARRCSKEIGIPYDKALFVIAHMGGGFSIAAHEYGRIVDSTNASNGEGPFSPERAGAVPAIPLVNLCFSGKYEKEQIELLFSKKGGLSAHLGTTDLRVCEKKMAEGDAKAALLFQAMAYRVAKEIGAMAAVLHGSPDAIILTGGLAYSERFVSEIRQYIEPMGRVFVYPGEDELLAMAQGALRILRGEHPVDYAASKRQLAGVLA